MQKKLTITLDEQVYEGLQSVIGPENISEFIEDLVRPHVIATDTSEPEAEHRTQADIDAMREDWGKWYAANPNAVLSRAEMEAGYRAMTRVLNHAGRVSSEDMPEIEQAIMAQLGLTR